MSGRHKRKRRDMHVDWMHKSLICLTKLINDLRIWRVEYKNGAWRGGWARGIDYDYCRRMYELKRTGRLR